jgi:hypothetical protein
MLGVGGEKPISTTDSSNVTMMFLFFVVAIKLKDFLRLTTVLIPLHPRLNFVGHCASQAINKETQSMYLIHETKIKPELW